MSSRNERLRKRRAEGRSLRQLAAEFGIHHIRVMRILDATGGDPLVEPRPQSSETQLRLERARLVRRRAADAERIARIDEELQALATDAILGL